MKRLVLLLSLAALFGTASARVYFGFPTTIMSVSGVSGVGVLGGVHVGSYDVGPNFGIRGVLETTAGLYDTLLTQGSADVMFTSGRYSTFYVGAGVGLMTTQNVYVFYANPFLGVDFDSGSALSYFIELNPRLYVGGGTVGALVFRAGLNFQLGLGPSPVPVATAPVVTTPVVEAPVAPASPYVNGSYTDEDGNVWLEPYTEVP